jgi:transposase
MLIGEAVNTAKLTADQVLEMRSRYSRGENQYKLAKAFGVHQATVFRIVTCKTWRHVAGEPVLSGQPRGERQGGSKLNRDAVISARARQAAGESIRSIARDLGVSHSTVRLVVTRQTWTHI